MAKIAAELAVNLADRTHIRRTSGGVGAEAGSVCVVHVSISGWEVLAGMLWRRTEREYLRPPQPGNHRTGAIKWPELLDGTLVARALRVICDVCSNWRRTSLTIVVNEVRACNNKRLW